MPPYQFHIHLGGNGKPKARLFRGFNVVGPDKTNKSVRGWLNVKHFYSILSLCCTNNPTLLHWPVKDISVVSSLVTRFTLNLMSKRPLLDIDTCS